MRLISARRRLLEFCHNVIHGKNMYVDVVALFCLLMPAIYLLNESINPIAVGSDDLLSRPEKGKNLLRISRFSWQI